MLSRSFLRHVAAPLRLGRQFTNTASGTFARPSDAPLPSHARVVVIGGGIIGNSVLYHLAKGGWKDVVLLERSQLTSGTTWHAAGLMATFGSKSETSTELRKYSKEMYASLEGETGLATGWKGVGFIELASDTDRLEEYRRIAAFNRKCGIDVHEITPSQVKELFPLCKTDDLLAGFYVPTDGRVNPVDSSMSIAKGARMHGAQIIENVSVTSVSSENGRVTGVSTNRGDIKCDYVVNCAGMWARQLGEISGVNIPNQAAEHYYLITEAIPEVSPDWPVIEDPRNYAYIRPEAGGLMVGLFEGKAAPWNVKSIPDHFSFAEIEPDWERMTPYLQAAMSRVPASLQAGMKKFFCGPESFTPDLAPIVGEAPELRNYFVCAGLNSIGITTGPGLGRLVAHWVMHGKPDMDVTGMNIDRLHKFQCTPMYREQRVSEALGIVYKCHYPTFSYQTARGVKKSAIYDRLAAKGAYFKDVSGWEGADWYAPAGKEAKVEQLCWNRHNWFPYWQEEHRACREGVIVMDMSFMSKFLVQGRDAGRILNRLSTANVDGEAGFITYTQWLNDEGKMEADITINKHSADKFTIVVTDTMHRHVETIATRAIGPNDHCTITDVTSGFTQLNVQGPHSRKLMQLLTDTDMSDHAFPFRASKQISIGMAKVTCVRITYLGELGYELYIPTEHSLHVYDTLVSVGQQVGLRHAGLKALASLRMEKGYRDFGHDMDNTDSLLEVGLGFTADFSKPGGFVGMEAVMKQKEAGLGNLPQRLLQILVKDPQPMMFHGEIVYQDGVVVGDIRAASYGHTLGGAVGLAMIHAAKALTPKAVEASKWEVDIAGKRYPAVASLKPMYDPDNKRIKM